MTLDQEIKHIWRTKWNLTTWIFFGNRYGPFLYVMAQLLPSVDRTVREFPLGFIYCHGNIDVLSYYFMYDLYRGELYSCASM